MRPRYWAPATPARRAIAKILAHAKQEGLSEEMLQCLEIYITLAFQRGYEHGQRKAKA